MKEIRIIGCDPAIRNFGFAIAMLNPETMEFRIEDLVLVKTEDEAGKQVRKNSDDIRRAKMLYDGMAAICKGASFMIAEVPVGSQSARAMASYGICCGVLAACPVPLVQVNPTEVKLAAVGSKHAAKEEMIEWATGKFPDAPWRMRKSKGVMVPTNDNEHLADAVAAIHAGLQTSQVRTALSMWKAAA